MTEHFGLPDLPLAPDSEEFLGIDKYADALVDFATQCDTPMTIALQGDWGSGKTSLMNLIKGKLGETNPNFIPIWFNTWQYSQFGQEKLLAISLMREFLAKLPLSPEEKEKTETFFKRGYKLAAQNVGKIENVGEAIGNSIGGLTGLLVKGVTSGVAAMAKQAQESIASSTEQKEENEIDPTTIITGLKDSLKETVTLLQQRNPDSRIVVFIDDIDRLAPIIAVELLESFKLFLDLPGCVFFLACDYKVVIQGLKAKFGSNVGDTNEKNFFDKIIQLPFKMPVTSYDASKYIKNLLDNIHIEYDGDKDIEQYKKLIENSIGFNPRGLKRAFNALLLLDIVVKKDATLNLDEIVGKTSEKQKLLFANICLQSAFEALHAKLSKADENDITQEMFDSLRNPASYDSDGEHVMLLSKLREENHKITSMRIVSFMNALYEAMQLESDGNDERLSKEEISTFCSMLRLSAITSASSDDLEKQIPFDSALSRQYKKLLDLISKKLDKTFKKEAKKLSCDFSPHAKNKGEKTEAYIVISGFDDEPMNNIRISLEKNNNGCDTFLITVDFYEYWDDDYDEDDDSYKGVTFANVAQWFNERFKNEISGGYFKLCPVDEESVPPYEIYRKDFKGVTEADMPQLAEECVKVFAACYELGLDAFE